MNSVTFSIIHRLIYLSRTTENLHLN